MTADSRAEWAYMLVEIAIAGFWGACIAVGGWGLVMLAWAL